MSRRLRFLIAFLLAALVAGGFVAATNAAADDVEPPTKVGAIVVSSTEISVRWTASATDDVDHYVIYRDGEKIKTVPDNPTVWLDQHLKPLTWYTYAVQAVKGDAKSDKVSAKKVRTQGPAKTPEQCPDGYNVVLDNNEHNRLMSQGVSGTPAEVLDQVMSAAKHDPRILLIYYNASPLGKKQPLTDTQSLVTDGCYNSHGRDVYNQTLAVWTAASAEPGQAPDNGTNTGAYPNGQAFQESGPITGDRTAVKFTFQNGDVAWVMHRCGNVVVTTPIPNVPPKSPPPPSPPPSTPPPSTPPSTPPVTHKCDKQTGKYCGSNTTGPEQQQQPTQQQPTPGYTPGNAEHVSEQQQPSNQTPSQQTGNEPTPKGTDSGSYDNNSNVPSGADNGNTTGGGNSGISNDPTPPPDSGSTSGDPCGGDPSCGGQ